VLLLLLLLLLLLRPVLLLCQSYLCTGVWLAVIWDFNFFDKTVFGQDFGSGRSERGLREGWRKSQVLREKQRSLFVGMD
jgi:hypothetical protein